MQDKQPRVKVKAKRTVNIANAVARSVNQTARHTAKQTRPPLRAPLYTPITPRARRQASAKVGTTQPHGRGAVVVSQHPKHPFPKQKVISHNAVVRAKQRENQRALNLSKTHPLEALKDPTHPIPTFSHSLVGEGLTHALHRQATLMGQAQQGAASGAIPGATIQVKGDPARVGRITQNAVKDAINTPAQAVVSTYHIAHAGVKAAGGDTKELKQLGHSLANDTFIGNLVQGNFKKAGKIAEQHPLNSALELSGAKAIVGRGAGAALRHSPTEKLRVVAATERVPKVVAGTQIAQKTRYSSDLINKGVQVAAENVGKRHANRTLVQAKQAAKAGNDERAAELRGKVTPNRVSEHQIRKRVNEHVDMAETIRRVHRPRVVKSATKVGLKSKRGGTAQVLVTQNIVRATKADLSKYHDELLHQFEHGDLSNAQKAGNRSLRKQIKVELGSKKVNYAKVELQAREYERTVRPLQKKLQEAGVLGGESQNAALIPYAVRNMKASPAKEGLPTVKMAAKEQAAVIGRSNDEFFKHMRDAARLARKEGPKSRGVQAALNRAKRSEQEFKAAQNGGTRALTAPEIRAHMAAHGVPEPAFVTQRPNMRGAKNFFISSHQARGVGGKNRTGTATLKGTFDAHPDVLHEGAARMQGLVDAHENFKRFVSEFSLRASADSKTKLGKGRPLTFHTQGAAQRAADELMHDHNGLPVPGQHKFRAIRIQPFQGRADQFRQLLEDVSSEHQGQHATVQNALIDALQGKPGEGKWALVPEVAADQLAKHVRVLGAGPLGKTGQVVNSAFRRTVLATNPRWLVGNVTEAGLRTAIDRAGPRSYLTMRKVLKQLPAAEHEQLQARAFAGGHYSFADRNHLYRSSEQFANTRMAPVAKALHAFWRAPGPRQASFLWRNWTSAIFGANGWVETQFQLAMGGKYVRANLMDANSLKLGQKAVQQAAEGLRGTSEQVALARAVDRAYGRYSKFSPTGRQAIAYYTPFIAWSLNALRFVYDVLPRDHPVLTGALVTAQDANEEWLNDQKLNKFITGRLPEFLQGSIPTGGGHLRANRYTPFGFFSDPLGGLAGGVLPQGDSVLEAFKGRDWLGKTLLDKNGDPVDDLGKFSEALKTFAQATVPVLGQASRVKQSGLRQTFDPFAVTKSKPKTSTGRVHVAAPASTEPLAPSQTSTREPLAPSSTTTKEPLAP